MAEETNNTEITLEPGMDYNALRLEGIEELGRLSGKIWTDYNPHDPGVTILEQLCFLITDHSYRLSFDIEDLLTPESGTIDDTQDFFSAGEVLTNAPLTMEDYRRLVHDVEGVRNVWGETVGYPYPALYFDRSMQELVFDPPEDGKQVFVQGLYRIFLELEQGASDSVVKSAVQELLNRNRNLCEDFADINILENEEINIRGEFDLERGADQDAIFSRIHYELQRFIAPRVQFESLTDLLALGKDPANIFEGPKPQGGFISDEEINRNLKKSEIRISDLIHVILDIPEVVTVRTLALSIKENPLGKDWKDWSLSLSTGRSPALKSPEDIFDDGNFKFYKNRSVCPLSKTRIMEHDAALKAAEKPEPDEFTDLEIQLGDYREPGHYLSVQEEFPDNYGIGSTGLPDSASALRKAQANQLRGYLALYDQLLANYGTQLSGARKLFAVKSNIETTYFGKNLMGEIPEDDGAALLSPGYEALIKDDLTEEMIDKDRRSRLMDHMLARFGEEFTDHSLLQLSAREDNNENKKRMLENAASLAHHRSVGYDYLSPEVWDTDNISGVKRRISALLGITNSNRRTLADKSEQGFHLIEHILLRPSEKGTIVGPLYHEINSFRDNLQGSSTCFATGHGLGEGDLITVFDTQTFFDGLFTVRERLLPGGEKDPDSCDIDKTFREGQTIPGGKWMRGHGYMDPYSLRASAVFPAWLGKYSTLEYRRVVRDVVRRETPAHVATNVFFLDKVEFELLETHYKNWLEKKSAGTLTQTDADALLELLL